MSRNFGMAALLLAFGLSFTAGDMAAQVKKAPVKKAPAVTRPVAKRVAAKPAGTRIKITTDSGVIVVRLYDKTPLHRDNFKKLVSEHFYDSLIFHRVINGFMIQGGDPQSKYADPNAMLGSGDVGYTIPAEFDTSLFHKKGALAAARNNNPERASSGCQFYIVQGKKYSDADLNNIEAGTGLKFSPYKRNIYKTIGGTPFLDMNYTVFGEVESGLNIIDKIASVPTMPGDRPAGNIRMKMEIIK